MEYRFYALYMLVFIFALPANIYSQTYKTTSAEVVFVSKAPLNEFTGKSNNLNGLIDLEKKALDFYIDLNTLDTGIGLRDSHMRENYLETEKYPFGEFTGEIISDVRLVVGEEVPVTAKGNFKIHGIEKEIEVSGTLKALSISELTLAADFTLLLSDFEIDIPKIVFYELAEEQLVSIKAVLKK